MRRKQALRAVSEDRKLRLKQEEKEEKLKLANRGNSMLDDQARVNLLLVYGCRPSAGVKGNTKMVKNILHAFIKSADRINCMTTIPWCFDFIDSSDAQFETATSSKI